MVSGSSYNIIIPTLNRKDLLLESLEDLKLNVLDSEYCKSLIIIDNGSQDIKPIHPKMKVLTQDKNLGVASSWNLGLSFSKDVSASYILNDDIVLGKSGQLLSELVDKAINEDHLVATSHGYWSVILVTNKALEVVGKFDEKFYPAYYEDSDYSQRLRLIKKPHALWEQLNAKVFRNSQTIAKDPSVNSKFDANKQYYFQKFPKEKFEIHENFIFSGETEILKARITETANYVSGWHITEWGYTFQNNRRELISLTLFNDPWFAQYKDRLHFYYPPNGPLGDTWQNEYYVRNYSLPLIKEALSSKLKDTECWLFSSDCDELPNYPKILKFIFETERATDKSKLYCAEMWDQYYSVDWTFRSRWTVGAFQCLNSSNVKTTQELRTTPPGPQKEWVLNAGWHLSYFMTPEKIAEKIKSFAHHELNTPFYTNIERIKNCVELGKDLYNRGEDLIPTKNILSYEKPKYFKNKENYKMSKLQELGLKYGTDKATHHNFCDFYQEHLYTQLKLGKGSLLELGTGGGASLRMWAEWLPNLKVEGWDYKSEITELFKDDSFAVKVVDCSSSEQMIEAAAGRKFRLIIDDASHMWADQIKAFNALWPLTSTYIMEDIHTSNRQEYANNPFPPFNPLTKEFQGLEFGDEPAEVLLFQDKPNDSWTVIFKKIKKTT